MSHGATELVVGRFLQGLGGSLSGGVIVAIIVTEFTKPVERAQAMSVFTFVIAGGGSIGLLAGGALTEWANWHWIFFINLPIGIATLLFGAWLMDENRGLGLRHGVDWIGAVLITAAVMSGVYAIVTASDQGWTSTHTLGFGGLAIALLGVFLVVQGRVRNPLMPLRILRIRTLTGASAARALLIAGMFTNFFVGALYLQHVHGFSAFATGLAFLPSTLALGVLWGAGALQALSLKLNFVNFAVLPITFGIGVDYAVNLYQRYRQTCSVEEALSSSGGAVALCSVTTMIGYATLVTADNQAIQSFGLTAVIGEITCLTAALFALPAVISLRDRRRTASLPADAAEQGAA